MNAVTAIADVPNPLAGMFMKTEEVGPPSSILLMGEPGTFKTTIAGGLIKVDGFNKILYVDIDNGAEVFVNDPEVYATIGSDPGAPGEKRINIFQIDKTSPDAFGQLLYILGGTDPATGQRVKGVAFDPALGYDAVIFDALDVGQEVVVEYLLANTFSENGKPNTMKAWGEVSKWTADLAWAFQNHPTITGVIVMHSKVDSDEATGKVKIKPKVQGSVKDSLAGIPSLVAYLELKEDKETKETHIVANVGKSELMTTKNRYSMTEPIVDFSMTKLYELVEARTVATHAAIAEIKAAKVATAQPAAVAA